jgi:5-hydroxyisourate hydrolase
MEVGDGDLKHVTKSITFSTHVLDTSTGVPAPGVTVQLRSAAGLALEGATDEDGRLRFPEALVPGTYEVSFDLRAHFAERPHLSDRVQVQVRLDDPRHYHLPLLVSPFGFASYRGS